MEPTSLEKQITCPVEEIAETTPSKRKPSLRNVYLATFAAQLYIITMGMVATYSSPAGADMQRPGSRFKNITSDQITWIASLPMLAGMSGNVLSGYVSHKFGRKATLMCLSVTYTVSWLMIAYAPTVGVVYAGRILCGISAGMCTVAVPAYVVEVATVEIRGLLTATFQVAMALGAFFMNGSGIFLRWSWLAIVGAVTAVSGASLLFFMPESPVWLVRANRKVEATKALTFLRGEGHDVEAEMKEIMKHLEEDPQTKLNLKELLNPGLYKPLLIGIVLMFNMCFCGFVVILSYSVEVFEKSGDSVDPNVASTVVISVQVIATTVSSLLMDRAGRKVLYISSGITMSLSLVIFGTYSYYATVYQPEELARWSWVPIFSLVACLATFSIGLGSIPFVVIPELVPASNRSFVMAVGAIAGSLFGFIITKIYVDMRNSIGMYGTYWIYGLVSLLGAVFYLFFVPETKGRTIQDINKSFTVSQIFLSTNL